MFPRTLLLAVVSLIAVPAAGQEAAPASAPATRAAQPVPTIDELILFQPAKYPRGHYDQRPACCQEVWFAAADKTRLHGWYAAAEKPVGIVLYCHGNAGNVSLYGRWMEYLQAKQQLSVLVFDYRGYGRSEGFATIDGAIADSKAARGELARLAGVKSSEILLWGRSLGGAMAVQLAAEEAPRGLILESTFSSFRDVADVHRPAISWLVPEDRLNSVTAIQKVRCPLLQSHGTIDRVVPYNLGKKLYAAAAEPKTLLTFEGYGHDGQPPEFEDRMREFVRRLVPPSRPAPAVGAPAN